MRQRSKRHMTLAYLVKTDTKAVLPDFRNLGVVLRSILLVQVMLCLFALVVAPPTGAEVVQEIYQAAANVEPVLLLSLLLLFVIAPGLGKIPYRAAAALVICAAAILASGWNLMLSLSPAMPPQAYAEAFRAGLLGSVAAFVTVFYFNWRHRVFSPALTEARLMALQARIRPHFLFNSLNTVLGLLRDEPRRAETVLENLAELYRALLSETSTLVPLARELELAHAYAEIETMRLGERLRVNWQCQDAALDALVPPLMLQPLLENAVYHGVEPSESGGEVDVSIFLKGDQINLVMRNPCVSPTRRQAGNRMALNNIRERLALHFDAEAEMSTYKSGEEFVVQIRMPYKHGRTA